MSVKLFKDNTWAHSGKSGGYELGPLEDAEREDPELVDSPLRDRRQAAMVSPARGAGVKGVRKFVSGIKTYEESPLVRTGSALSARTTQGMASTPIEVLRKSKLATTERHPTSNTYTSGDRELLSNERPISPMRQPKKSWATPPAPPPPPPVVQHSVVLPSRVLKYDAESDVPSSNGSAESLLWERRQHEHVVTQWQEKQGDVKTTQKYLHIQQDNHNNGQYQHPRADVHRGQERAQGLEQYPVKHHPVESQRGGREWSNVHMSSRSRPEQTHKYQYQHQPRWEQQHYPHQHTYNEREHEEGLIDKRHFHSRDMTIDTRKPITSFISTVVERSSPPSRHVRITPTTYSAEVSLDLPPAESHTLHLFAEDEGHVVSRFLKAGDVSETLTGLQPGKWYKAVVLGVDAEGRVVLCQGTAFATLRELGIHVSSCGEGWVELAWDTVGEDPSIVNVTETDGELEAVSFTALGAPCRVAADNALPIREGATYEIYVTSGSVEGRMMYTAPPTFTEETLNIRVQPLRDGGKVAFEIPQHEAAQYTVALCSKGEQLNTFTEGREVVLAIEAGVEYTLVCTAVLRNSHVEYPGVAVPVVHSLMNPVQREGTVEWLSDAEEFLVAVDGVQESTPVVGRVFKLREGARNVMTAVRIEAAPAFSSLPLDLTVLNPNVVNPLEHVTIRTSGGFCIVTLKQSFVLQQTCEVRAFCKITGVGNASSTRNREEVLRVPLETPLHNPLEVWCELYCEAALTCRVVTETAKRHFLTEISVKTTESSIGLTWVSSSPNVTAVIGNSECQNLRNFVEIHSLSPATIYPFALRGVGCVHTAEGCILTKPSPPDLHALYERFETAVEIHNPESITSQVLTVSVEGQTATLQPGDCIKIPVRLQNSEIKGFYTVNDATPGCLNPKEQSEMVSVGVRSIANLSNLRFDPGVSRLSWVSPAAEFTVSIQGNNVSDQIVTNAPEMFIDNWFQYAELVKINVASKHCGGTVLEGYIPPYGPAPTLNLLENCSVNVLEGTAQFTCMNHCSVRGSVRSLPGPGSRYEACGGFDLSPLPILPPGVPAHKILTEGYQADVLHVMVLSGVGLRHVTHDGFDIELSGLTSPVGAKVSWPTGSAPTARVTSVLSARDLPSGTVINIELFSDTLLGSPLVFTVLTNPLPPNVAKEVYSDRADVVLQHPGIVQNNVTVEYLKDGALCNPTHSIEIPKNCAVWEITASPVYQLRYNVKHGMGIHINNTATSEGFDLVIYKVAPLRNPKVMKTTSSEIWVSWDDVRASAYTVSMTGGYTKTVLTNEAFFDGLAPCSLYDFIVQSDDCGSHMLEFTVLTNPVSGSPVVTNPTPSEVVVSVSSNDVFRHGVVVDNHIEVLLGGHPIDFNKRLPLSYSEAVRGKIFNTPPEPVYRCMVVTTAKTVVATCLNRETKTFEEFSIPLQHIAENVKVTECGQDFLGLQWDATTPPQHGLFTVEVKPPHGAPFSSGSHLSTVMLQGLSPNTVYLVKITHPTNSFPAKFHRVATAPEPPKGLLFKRCPGKIVVSNLTDSRQNVSYHCIGILPENLIYVTKQPGVKFLESLKHGKKDPVVRLVRNGRHAAEIEIDIEENGRNDRYLEAFNVAEGEEGVLNRFRRSEGVETEIEVLNLLTDFTVKTASQTAASVQWTATQESYEYEVSLSSSLSHYKTTTTQPSVSLTSLLPSVLYRINIVSIDMQSTPLKSAFLTLPVKPVPPDVTMNGLFIHFTVPKKTVTADRVETVFEAVLERKSGGGSKDTVYTSSGQTERVEAKLRSGSVYSLRYYTKVIHDDAVNNGVISEMGVMQIRTETATPSKIRLLKSSRTPTIDVTIGWDVGDDSEGLVFMVQKVGLMAECLESVPGLSLLELFEKGSCPQKELVRMWDVRQEFEEKTVSGTCEAIFTLSSLSVFLFRVRCKPASINGAPWSPWSATTPLRCSVRHSPVNDLHVQSAQPKSLLLSWSPGHVPGQPNPSAYIVSYRPVSMPHWESAVTFTSHSPSALLENLMPNTQYKVKVTPATTTPGTTESVSRLITARTTDDSRFRQTC